MTSNISPESERVRSFGAEGAGEPPPPTYSIFNKGTGRSFEKYYFELFPNATTQQFEEDLKKFFGDSFPDQVTVAQYREWEKQMSDEQLKAHLKGVGVDPRLLKRDPDELEGFAGLFFILLRLKEITDRLAATQAKRLDFLTKIQDELNKLIAGLKKVTLEDLKAWNEKMTDSEKAAHGVGKYWGTVWKLVWDDTDAKLRWKEIPEWVDTERMSPEQLQNKLNTINQEIDKAGQTLGMWRDKWASEAQRFQRQNLQHTMDMGPEICRFISEKILSPLNEAIKSIGRQR